MTFKQSIKQLVFVLTYVPFATAVLIYLFSGGEIGAEAMIEAVVLPWWLPLIATPILLILIIVGLGILNLDELL